MHNTRQAGPPLHRTCTLHHLDVNACNVSATKELSLVLAAVARDRERECVRCGQAVDR